MNFLTDTLSAFNITPRDKKSKKRDTDSTKENTPADFQLSHPPKPTIVVETIENPVFEDAMAKMNITIPRSLKMRFKSKCSHCGTDMSKMVNFWVKQFLAQDAISEVSQNEN